MSEGEGAAAPRLEPPARPVGSPLQPCASDVAEDWLELEVLDHRGEPLVEEPYVLITPGGVRRRGVTDAQGRARIEHVESGRCEVWLPRREPDDYGPPPASIEFRVLEADGQTPRAGEPFVARFEDGSQRRGRLDGEGYVRLDGVYAGTCELSFPALGDGWEPI